MTFIFVTILLFVKFGFRFFYDYIIIVLGVHCDIYKSSYNVS
jgi:hypothetical protein